MWAVVGVLLAVWLVLKFGLGKGGFIHIVLVTALSIAIVQIIADRKTRYQKKSSGKSS
jgi:hypothetical protein